jgi:hypothetical protein
MGKQNREVKKSTPELVPQQVVAMDETEEPNSTKYVVIRGGARVSDKEYDTPTDPICEQETEFWKRVATNFSYGEKVEVVVYDSKKHRVW